MMRGEPTKMSIRRMVKKVTVEACEENEQQKFVLEYYTLERETNCEGFTANTYGIEVLKRSNPTPKTLKVEYRKIFDIFCTEAEAIEAICVLARNTVTPISVCDIIEQFIGTNEFECEEYEVLAV